MFAQSCRTLCDPIDCSAPGSFPLGVVQARKLESFLFPTQRIFPDPGIEPASPALAGRFFTTEPPEEPLLLSHFSRVQLCANP